MIGTRKVSSWFSPQTKLHKHQGWARGTRGRLTPLWAAPGSGHIHLCSGKTGPPLPHVQGPTPAVGAPLPPRLLRPMHSPLLSPVHCRKTLLATPWLAASAPCLLGLLSPALSIFLLEARQPAVSLVTVPTCPLGSAGFLSLFTQSCSMCSSERSNRV